MNPRNRIAGRKGLLELDVETAVGGLRPFTRADGAAAVDIGL
jgi:hypothetical protein